jgi:hypothetical protein
MPLTRTWRVLVLGIDLERLCFAGLQVVCCRSARPITLPNCQPCARWRGPGRAGPEWLPWQVYRSVYRNHTTDHGVRFGSFATVAAYDGRLPLSETSLKDAARHPRSRRALFLTNARLSFLRLNIKPSSPPSPTPNRTACSPAHVDHVMSDGMSCLSMCPIPPAKSTRSALPIVVGRLLIKKTHRHFCLNATSRHNRVAIALTVALPSIPNHACCRNLMSVETGIERARQRTRGE